MTSYLTSAHQQAQASASDDLIYGSGPIHISDVVDFTYYLANGNKDTCPVGVGWTRQYAL